jgi:Zn-dependent peptidase ImmA (M78 family)
MVMRSETQLPEKWTNPEVLKWARLRMGLKPGDLEELEKIRAEDIIQWESGKSAPSLSDLESLAESYKCPVGFFFLEKLPMEEKSLDLRGLNSQKAGSLSYATHSQLEEFFKLTDYIAALNEKTGRTNKVELGEAHLSESISTVAERERINLGFSTDIRHAWNTENEAYEFWKRAIEYKGVYVIELKLEPDEVRGASRWDVIHTPAILVNRQDNEAATGRCFTLLHEYAHLLLKKPGLVCDFRGQEHSARIEAFANKFAAELLVPANELIEVLKDSDLFEFRQKWGDGLIDSIRRKFKVSKDVIAILLEELDLAPKGFYWSKHALWEKIQPFFRGKPGVHRGQTKAARKLREIGLPFANLVSEAYGLGVMSKLELADLLNMKIEQAEEFALRPPK